ncbi:hypothetical protein [Actimicrobium antarcticum]|uniref:Uncharacterized protein n=1 Tax=Actimicrobium antarcticum TaxID=1051899 RepID=A0ABP7TGQ1_9BURK
MAKIEDVVQRQKEGARFVITAPMLGLTEQEFDVLASDWVEYGGAGFEVAGVPHRTCIDGEFFINRITVVKLPVV